MRMVDGVSAESVFLGVVLTFRVLTTFLSYWVRRSVPANAYGCVEAIVNDVH